MIFLGYILAWFFGFICAMAVHYHAKSQGIDL